MIADLCPYWTNPTTGGGPERVSHICQALSTCDNLIEISYRPTLTMFKAAKTLRGERRIDVSERYGELQILHFPAMISSFITRGFFLPPDLLMSKTVSLLEPKSARRILKDARLIQVEHPWLFDYALRKRTGNTKLALSTHNCETSLLKHAEVARDRKGLSVRLASNIERRALREADLVLAVSDDDIEDFKETLDVDVTDKALVVPNGVDTDLTRPVPPAQKSEAKARLGISSEKLAIFIGSRHEPNVQAVRETLKAAGRFRPEQLSIFVVGSAGEGFHNTSNVIFPGHVADYREYLAAADIALNPLLSGSGTSLKALEYLAAGIPTISTPVGVRGLAVENRKHVLMTEAEDLAGNIEVILTDADLTNRLSVEARRLAVSRYDWRIIQQKMIEGYHDKAIL